ncbi:MAG: rhomboid family protein [Acidobacteriia bacterium]|nr:rhomboid family protein [Terriglobia bacterium]
MPALTIHHRCWNHEAREAVCRCPECGRSFCRECVTEHEARLLCASCLKALARTPQSRRGRIGRLLPAGMVLAGIFLAWLVFFGAGAAFNLFASRVEQSPWQSR